MLPFFKPSSLNFCLILCDETRMKWIVFPLHETWIVFWFKGSVLSVMYTFIFAVGKKKRKMTNDCRCISHSKNCQLSILQFSSRVIVICFRSVWAALSLCVWSLCFHTSLLNFAEILALLLLFRSLSKNLRTEKRRRRIFCISQSYFCLIFYHSTWILGGKKHFTTSLWW